MRTKLTPQLVAQIHDRHRQGARYEDLAAEFQVSQGSVRNALKRAQASEPTLKKGDASPDAPAGASGTDDTLVEPPTHDDVRRWLGEQVAALRADAVRFRAQGDAPSLERCNRALVAASGLLARVTPDPPAPDADQFVQVPAGEMDALGAQVAERFFKMLDLVVEERAGECTACPTCGRPQAVAP